MNYHVLTLFPEMVEQGLHTSIIGRAMEQGLLSLSCVNIRDYAGNKHMKVDDYPYGGGAGMVMQAEPVYTSYQAVKREDRICAACHLPDAPGRCFQPENGTGAGTGRRSRVPVRTLRRNR